MKLGIAFVILAATGMVSAQGAQSNAHRIEEIRTLAVSPADLSSLPKLQRALDDKNPSVRLEALKTWAKVGDKYETEFYSQFLEDDPNSTGEGRSLTSNWRQSLLAQIRPKATDSEEVEIQALRTLCCLSYSVMAICPPQFECGNGIEETLFYQASGVLKTEVATRRPRFLALLESKDPQVAYGALVALGDEFAETQNKRARSYLTNPDKRFKAIGAKLICDHWQDSAITLLTPLFDDPDPVVQKIAERNTFFKDQEALDFAMPATGRPVKLRLRAIEFISEDRSEKRDQVLQTLVSDTNDEIRASALQRLVGYNGTDDVDLVQKFLSDPAPNVRATALMAAANSKMSGLIPILKEALVSPDRLLRETALWCVSKVSGHSELFAEQIRCVDLGVEDNYNADIDFDNPRFAHLIDECLNSKNPEVRQLLSFYYGSEIRVVKPVDLMIRLAKDPDPDVARIIVSDLGELSDQKAFEALVELAGSPHKSVKTGAIYGLGKCKRQAAISVLQKLTLDKDREVRMEAKQALAKLKKYLGQP